MLYLKCQFWYLPQRASLAHVGSQIGELRNGQTLVLICGGLIKIDELRNDQKLVLICGVNLLRYVKMSY